MKIRHHTASNKIKSKRRNTELGRNSFAYKGSVAWNSLDRSTRDYEKVDSEACEQAPSEGEKKIRRTKRESASEASRPRVTPSSPDRSRLVILALDYTRLL